MRRVGMAMVLVLTGALLLSGTALANDASVRKAIEASGKQAKESGELKEALKELKEEPKTLEKVHSAIAKFETALRKVVVTVDAQHASTANGKMGKADFVGGLQKAIAGFSDLDKAITDIKNHEKTAAKAEALKAATLVKAGAIEAKKGETLLHVKQT